jgi:glucarate dehydratase
MKIVSVKATPVNIPFRAPYVYSHGSIASLTKTVVEVQTDAGVVGLGEVADGDRAADVMAMGQRLAGLDIRAIGVAERRCLTGVRYTPWGNVQGMRRAFGGIEMALWDALGRIQGVPLVTLLGGPARDQVALTEYFSFRLPGADPGEATPGDVARYCARMVEEHDADAFEGKVGTTTLEEEVKMIAGIRAAIGPDRRLSLDANGGWSVATARAAVRKLDAFGIHYYEDPVETYEEMAQLRGATAASFSTHIIDLPEAVRLKAPDCIVTNLNEHGGIARTVAFIRACETFDVAFRFHSGETSIASAAYLHVSAAMDHVREPSQTLFRWYADDVVQEGTFVPKNGRVPVPKGPGLGVTLDRKALQRCHERYRAEGQFPQGKGGRFRDRFTKV